MTHEYSNESIPSNLLVKREGSRLILKGRTATITIYADRWRELVAAIKDVSEQ